MALRTVEQLKEYFAERRRINRCKQEKAKEQKLKIKKQKQKEYQEYYRSLGKTKDKALKDSKLQEVYELARKIKFLQEDKTKTKEPISQFIYQVNGSNIIARENREDSLYTMYELQHIEDLYPEETGRINWKLWNILVTKLRKEFQKLN